MTARVSFIVNPNNNDVLFDRCGGLLLTTSSCSHREHKHGGSERFREMCRLNNRAVYYFSTANDKRQEQETTNHHTTIVACRIIDAIKPGRFLQLIPKEDAEKKGFSAVYNSSGSVWQEISSSTALDLVKRYLLDDASQLKDSDISPLDEIQQQTLPNNSTNATADVNEKGIDDDKIDTTTPKELYSLLAQEEADERMTEDDIRNEQEKLTAEECFDIQNDVFGNNNRSATTNRPIMAPTASVAGLLQDMRNEIKGIPEQDKPSLTEAQTKADASEFGDARLELYLRREGMDPRVCVRVCSRYKN